jgi:hypothetical protein
MDWTVILVALISSLSTIVASSGLWVYMDRKRSTRKAMERLLIGIAHNEIVQLSHQYIERGFITQDEYENLYKFLFIPYLELGGNGSANRLMTEVNKLPLFNQSERIKSKIDYSEALKGE